MVLGQRGSDSRTAGSESSRVSSATECFVIMEGQVMFEQIV